MHPPLEPFATGRLARPGGVELYWETSGARDGHPLLYLHGGPGGGLGLGGYRRRADPERHLIVGLDQRGCGRSTPLACESLATLDENTTPTLIADIEALREHLGVERWLVHGASWGATLALAYALAHPERVSEIVLFAVTTTSRAEVDWITERVGALFPEAWAQLVSEAGLEPRDPRMPAPDGSRVVEAYARLLRDPDEAVRMRAADSWDAWESTHVALDPAWQPGPMHEDPLVRLNFATLVTHYWANDAFLPDERSILSRIAEIGRIPAVLVHGRRDVSGPSITPWLLHERWPASRLEIVAEEGHGGPQEVALVERAIEELSRSRA